MALVDSSPNHPNKGPGLIIGFSFLAAFTTVIFGARIWSRRLTRQYFELDDHLCLASLVIQHGVFATAVVMVAKGGLGKDMSDAMAGDPNVLVVLPKTLFILKLIYAYSSPLVKLSVLALYWRIFPTAYIKLGCKIIGGLNVAWCVGVTVFALTQCRPLKALWDVELRALPTTKCIDSCVGMLVNAIANCIIDLLTLVLPLYEIAKLRVSSKRRFTIGGVFLLGGIAFAASLVRSVFGGILTSKGISANLSLDLVPPIAADVVEVYVSIIGACMPTLVPVYRQLRYGSPLKSHHTSASSQEPLPTALPASGASGSRKKTPSERDSVGSNDHLISERKRYSVAYTEVEKSGWKV